ncbi:flagellar protein FlaG [Dasania marina]|uniref:flagellar protein FlaG n=1 Tax=Dasania marina TaxID=471499 RepID=UPI0009FEEBCB|nr:flagellar protein FlaG [Dasania marina]
MTTSISNLSDRLSGSIQVSTSSEPSSPPNVVKEGSVAVANANSSSVAKNEEYRAVNGVINPQDKAQVEEVLKKMNLAVEQIQKGLNFSIDEDRGGFIIKVIDQSTDETIRQIPSEEMLNIYHRLKEVNSLLFDDIKA